MVLQRFLLRGELQMIINEREVREVAGVSAVDSYVTATELETTVRLSTQVKFKDVHIELSIHEARRLARQIYRMARRVELRNL